MLRNVRGKWQGRVYWDLPGGRIHEDETAERALKRTVSKEIGTSDFTMGKIVGTYFLKTDIEYRIGYMILVYRCDMQKETIELCEDHDRWGWFSKEEIKKLESDGECYKEAALAVLAGNV